MQPPYDSKRLTHDEFQEFDFYNDFEDDFDEDDDDLEEDYNQLSVQTESRAISFIEMAMINTYMYQSSLGKHKDFIVKSYGTTDAIGRLSFGSSFSHTNALPMI